MKTIYAVLLAVIFSIELHAQTSPLLKLSDKKSFFSNSVPYAADSMSRNLQHFPFQFGIEACIPFGESRMIFPGGILYIDINIWNKIVFMKIEYGMFNNSDKSLTKFGSLGGQVKFANINNIHKLYAGFNISFLSSASNHEGWPLSGGYIKYLYAVNKYIGITAGAHVFATGKDLFIEIGCQLFH
jgi:hypothetical protein